jgi:hypothetical protein
MSHLRTALRDHGMESEPVEPAPQGRGKEVLSDLSVLSPQWPSPLSYVAFRGPAGEIAGAIEPHSEADPAGLLVQFLVAVGNLIGRSPHFVAENNRHHLNLFAVLVGLTSKGRKGSSLGQVLRFVGGADHDWKKNCVQSGLSSGEGLIWAVRDEVTRCEPIKQKGRVIDYETIITDQGVGDKRLLVIESEFAGTLKVATREANTLSAVTRQAWDDGNLRTLVKNSPAKASDAHISIIGHITKDELNRFLNSTEASNGFANRFLWCCVKRSKYLPEGGEVDPMTFDLLTKQLGEVVRFASSSGQMRRDDAAREMWKEIYPKLSDGGAGLLGAVTSRAEAQVMRLACLYALLDRSIVVTVPQLEAALEVWRYCQESARFIFSDALGDPTADTILETLRQAGEVGLTRTQIRDLFSRSQSAGAIGRALTVLRQAGLARCQIERSESSEGGRPTEKWLALMPTKPT